MKKKYTEDSENEFEVDEPEELEESDDDWTPAASETRGGRRQSSRRGRTPVSAKKPRLAEPRTSEDDEEEEEEEEEEEGGEGEEGEQPERGDEEDEEEEGEEEEEESQPESEEENDKAKKKRGRGGNTAVRGGRGRGKKNSTTVPPCAFSKDKGAEGDITSTTGSENALPIPVEKEFTSGAFVVLKADFQNQKDPPIWKIDGKALLQKYVPFEQDGKIMYRNTSTYSGWSTVLKDRYYPAEIAYKMQNRKETIVEFLRDKIKVEDSE